MQIQRELGRGRTLTRGMPAIICCFMSEITDCCERLDGYFRLELIAEFPEGGAAARSPSHTQRL